jgi:UDP-N-acetylmuramoyl-tripeptide--D-alanyl-D-alanine ligase
MTDSGTPTGDEPAGDEITGGEITGGETAGRGLAERGAAERGHGRCPLTAGDVAAAMDGRLVAGDATTTIDRFSIDSRALEPGDLFFAIRGERFDGHTFVGGAIAAGAAGVVVDETAGLAESELAGASIAIVVDDTTRGLQRLAREVRRRSGARVIAITGSAGKTTTKEVVAEFLSLRFRTFRNRGNLNNHIGLPLSLLELRPRPGGLSPEMAPEMAVVELGMSAPGEIRTLVAIAEPDVRVWTNVGEAHLESFPSVDAIADAKAEILEHADSSACLVINSGDARITARAGSFPGRTWTFGIDVAADVMATDVRDLGLDGMRATVVVNRSLVAGQPAANSSLANETAGSVAAGSVAGSALPAVTIEELDASLRATLAIPLLGRANLANVLAGIAVALDAGVPLVDLVERARSLKPASHRGEVKRLASGITVMDDAYNANPLAVKKALEVIAAADMPRRVAVLGEMLELGPESERLHRECGRAAVEARVDLLVTVGGAPARALGEAAIDAGLARDAVTHVADSAAAADVIEMLVKPGDVVLVKGSRGIRLERVVERLHGARG